MEKPDYAAIMLGMALSREMTVSAGKVIVFSVKKEDDAITWLVCKGGGFETEIMDKEKLAHNCGAMLPKETIHMILVVKAPNGSYDRELAHAHLKMDDDSVACTFNDDDLGKAFTIGACPDERCRLLNLPGDQSRALVVVDRTESAVKQLCACCGRLLRKNLWCTGCERSDGRRAVAYCGRECQLKDWPTHKRECKGRKKK